ncbi:hypothetical protein J2Z83_000609 [Virgibacillus natechei]|uniref:Uncharacterized protein n=1 Tax=Virgibacillus natechei TaxID=1216297 RepID=A0ABS4IC50_9BACI|nr:hypothetical protein [Virgibacillus natechei]MBP1968517.1 hypothetical protein [Virgibacillus natechei]UZD13632.1 hypothetical protein OLD84_03485 [Virgibacillus natechei]
MKNINSAEELYEELEKLGKDNSLTRFSIPGKGRFTLVYEENEKTIQEEVDEDEELKQMIHESRKDYKEGRYVTISEFIKSTYEKDFFNE